MIKKTIYPKTTRVGADAKGFLITEKMDGSNLCFFKKDDVLYIAQRKNIFTLEELTKQNAYKDLIEWLDSYGRWLQENLHPNAAICGEWLGMGVLKYDNTEFDKKFYMFAKANIDDNMQLYNIIYDHDYFIYSFVDQAIPSFIGCVPIVQEAMIVPTKEYLDQIYDTYCIKTNRNVEGFVISYNGAITKYVRMKRGKLQEHQYKGV